MAKSLRPLSDRVIVEPRPAVMATASGIVFADRFEVNHRNLSGTVIAVGPGALNTEDGTRTPIELQPGDLVGFKRFAGESIYCYGRTFLVLRAAQILGRIEEDGSDSVSPA